MLFAAKKYYFPVLFTLTFKTVCSQSLPDATVTSILQNNSWKPYKVVEVFNDKTTICIDSCVKEAPYQSLNGFWTVYPKFYSSYAYADSSIQPGQSSNKGKWSVNENRLIVDLKKEHLNENPIFSGNMEILLANDSALVVQKTIDRLGKWTRTFHFKSQ